MTLQAPPAFTPNQAAGGMAQHNGKAYWIYWGFSFGTLLTWVFAVSAAADDAWLSGSNGTTSLGLGENCSGWTDFCELYEGGTAFQYLATIVISFALVVVAIQAFMAPPKTGQLGLAVGCMLVVFSVFQLLAFALMAAYIEKVFGDISGIGAGPTLGVAVVAWLLGVVGAVVVLLFRARATTNQDGPFKKFIAGGASSKGDNHPAPAGQVPPPYSGTV